MNSFMIIILNSSIQVLRTKSQILTKLHKSSGEVFHYGKEKEKKIEK
jgi:hypothetical protein